MALSKPSVILILRHAEKPGDPSTDRESDGIHLSTHGYMRAAALAVYIPAIFPKPDYLFATRQSKRSNRSVETITPLAKALGLQIEANYTDDDYALLAKEILTQAKYLNKVVLICWHHGKIPQLTTVFGVARPPAWSGGVFDRVWRIDYPGGAAMLHDNPQMLMYGDSSS